ncbi:MAG TPA: S9 family peptidase [Thermoanaerobaculia bacterium]|nr:S9 family peptidase [Thermoanaerobaculia bacterium]
MIGALLLASTLTIQDYATMPALSTPRWSPDGKRIAYVVSKADLERSAYDSDVWVIDADGRNDRQLTRAKAADFRPRWSPDGKQLAFLSDRDGRNAVWLIDIDGGEARKLIEPPTAIREFDWSPDGKSIAFTRIDEPTPEEEKKSKEKEDVRVVGEDARQMHLHVADVATGKVRRMTGGAFSVFSFGWSPDGATIAYGRGPAGSLDDLYRTDLYAVDVKSGASRALAVRPGLDNNPVYSPDGKWIAFTSQAGTHGWLIEHDVHVMPASGGASRNVSKAYGRTPDSISWSDDSRAVYIEGPWNTTTQLYRVNADGTGWTDVTRRDGVIHDANVRGNRAAYVYESLSEPPELVVMVVGSRLSVIGESSPGGTGAANQQPATGSSEARLTNHNSTYRTRTLGETRLIRWKNPKDGLEIEGLLTFPVGYEGGRVPLLTFVHGGPASRFDQGFLGYHGVTYAPQVLAANGIAVLRPNPRGTGGYGAAFRGGNLNDWGGMDWIDINAGIDQLIADGIADPDRLGMSGWSYGGFIAAWAIGHSDRLKAISIGAPVADLLSFHGTSDIRDFIPHYFEQREAPDTTLDEMRHAPLSLELLRAHSPLWTLKKTKAKVLIQHGENDDRVPLSQGTMLYRVLDELGVDVKMAIYPRSGHGIREPKLRMDVMRRNVDFFTNNLLVPSIPRP